jgi:hypothetical protein
VPFRFAPLSVSSAFANFALAWATPFAVLAVIATLEGISYAFSQCRR